MNTEIVNEPEGEIQTEVPVVPNNRAMAIAAGVMLAMVFAVTLAMYIGVIQNQPPLPFPEPAIVVIPTGSSVDEIAHALRASGIIRSPFLFKLLVAVDGRSQSLKAGTYRFSEPLSTVAVMNAVIDGTHADTDVIVTIPEGTRATEIARIVTESMPHIERTAFEALLVPLEGYLFPETYHLAPTMTGPDIIELLSDTFSERMPVVPAGLGRTPDEIVTMASILEREGNSRESMGVIAGILWKRLEMGMPLQVDATLEYERGKGSADLLIEDLEADSPYNTYTRQGLPPTPISNPGSVALIAALEPTPSPYLYYLTGNDGLFYYAETFEEHKENKEQYLR